jgi:choline dehydrogenase-like flavoprotein
MDVRGRNSETEFLIIGSGVAGGLIAERLLARGRGPVTMLDAGPNVLMRDRRSWLDALMSGSLPYNNLGDSRGDFEASGSSPWNLRGSRLFARGGTTLHWGGWCPRMKPEDFELRSRIEFGGKDWPLRYRQLEPYYESAESFLQVAGDSADLDPPRRNPYPFEAAAYTMTDEPLLSTFKRLGVQHGHIPMARNREHLHGHPACITIGTCRYCPIGGRFTADQSIDRLSDYAEQGKFRLLTRSPVTRLLLSGKRHVYGAEYLNLESGETGTIEAASVILCAGALETPKLLLASAHPSYWPHGIGNDTDQVGRYLVANPFLYAKGMRASNPNQCQTELHFRTLGSRHFDTPEHQREGKLFLTKALEPQIKLAEQMAAGRSRVELEQASVGEQTMELQGTLQTFSHFENRVTLAPGTTRFGLPRTHIQTPTLGYSKSRSEFFLGWMQSLLEQSGFTPIPKEKWGHGIYPQRGDHAMCTTRMAESEASGVVDSNLKVFGTDNLYILSNAVFPSGAAVNPTLTLVALGYRFADYLLKEPIQAASLTRERAPSTGR